MKKIVLFFAVVTLLFSSCQQDPCNSKAKFEMSYNQFIDDFKSNKNDLTKTQKEEYKAQFDEFFNGCYKKYKAEMTLAEKQNFWKKSLVLVNLSSAEITNNSLSFEGDMDIDPEIKAELESVLKESGTQFVDSLKDLAKEELPKLIDRAIEEIGKIGEEIKEALEKQE